MNHCTLMAEIVEGPQLRYTQDNQTAIAELTISFPGLRAEDPSQQIKVIGWGNLAQEIQERYQVGERVLIEGRLTMNTVDRPEGFKEKQAELTAQRMYRISDLAVSDIPPAVAAGASGTPNVAPRQTSPTATAPIPVAAQSVGTSTAEPEVDYDDIPF